jgi:hypothetical protein
LPDQDTVRAPHLDARRGGTPSVWAFYRFTVKLRKNQPVLADCLDRVSAALQVALPEHGIDIAIDASDLPAFANGQRYVYNNGPERERVLRPRRLVGTAQRSQHARRWFLLRLQDSRRRVRPHRPAGRVAGRDSQVPAGGVARRQDRWLLRPL